MSYKQILYNLASMISPNYQNEISEVLKNNKKICIFDVGFYQGDFSINLINKLSMYKNLEEIIVYSFDPNKNIDLSTFNDLSKNKNIQWKHYFYALGDKNSIETFTTIKHFPSSGSSINNILKDSLWIKTRKLLLFPFLKENNLYESFNVDQRKLDSIEFGIDSVDILKIDVEGYSYEVLKGSVEFLTKYNPIIQVEILAKKNQFNESKVKICNFLNDINYELKLEKKHLTTHIFSDVTCRDLLFINKNSE